VEDSFDSDEEGVLIPRETPEQLQARIIAAFQDARNKPPLEIALVLSEHFKTVMTFSSSTLKEIITLSKNVYFVFSNPSVFAACPKEVKCVIADVAFDWLAQNILIDSRSEIPNDVVFFAGWSVSDPSSVAEELMVNRISQDLLNPHIQDGARVRLWIQLELLRSELIKCCLQLKNDQYRCLLGEVYDNDFSGYPRIKKALGELKTMSFDAVIQAQNLKDFKILLKGLTKPHHLEIVQVLISRLIRLVAIGESRNTYENFLEKCFVRLMHFSKPHEGLKIEREVLIRYLGILNQYILASSLESLLMKTLTPPDGPTLLSYIRRTVGSFGKFFNLNDMVVGLSVSRVGDLSIEDLSRAVNKGFVDVQGYLHRTLHKGVFYEKYALVVVEKFDADLDLAQDGMSFFSLALFTAGNQEGFNAGVKMLDFYIRQKIKQQGDATQVLSSVIDVFASNDNDDAYYYHRLPVSHTLRGHTATISALRDSFYVEYYQGCVQAVKGLTVGYGAKPRREMVEKISASRIPEAAKRAIIHYLQSAMVVFNPFEISDALEELSKRLVEPGNIESIDDLIQEIGRAVNLLSPAEKKSLCKRELSKASRELLCRVGVGFKALFEQADYINSLAMTEISRPVRHATAAGSAVSVQDNPNGVVWVARQQRHF